MCSAGGELGVDVEECNKAVEGWDFSSGEGYSTSKSQQEVISLTHLLLFAAKITSWLIDSSYLNDVNLAFRTYDVKFYCFLSKLTGNLIWDYVNNVDERTCDRKRQNIFLSQYLSFVLMLGDLVNTAHTETKHKGTPIASLFVCTQKHMGDGMWQTLEHIRIV